MNILPISVQASNSTKYNKTSFNGGTAKIAQKQLISNPDLSERMVTALQTDIKNRLGVEIPREYFEFHLMPIQTNKIKSIKSCNISSSTLDRNFYDDKDNIIGIYRYVTNGFSFSLNTTSDYFMIPDSCLRVKIEKIYTGRGNLMDISVGTADMLPAEYLTYTVKNPDNVSYRVWGGSVLVSGRGYNYTPLK